ncbi:MAG: hypothetical protein C4331_03050 [Meiothermus sp.]
MSENANPQAVGQDAQQPPQAAPTAPRAPASAARPPVRRRFVVFAVLAVILLGAAGIVLYYVYQGDHYVSTDNARVAANTAQVTPQIPGRILAWNVGVGSTVKAGQVIGQLDTDTVAQSSAVNLNSLSQVAPLTASRALVRAPISGRVIQSNALVGQLVNAGQSLAVVADTNSAYISANVKETQIGRVAPGQRVTVRLDAWGRSFQGRVQEIGQATASTFSILPNSNADTGNFTKVAQVVPVKIYPVEKPSVELLPGMSASVKVSLGAPPSDPIAVKTVKADERPLSLSVDVVGTLTAGSTLSVTPQLSGTVTFMGAEVGQAVKKGQILLKLDDSTLRAQLAQAQAALEQAQNTVQQTKANRDLAASTLDRVKALYKVGGASRQDLNNAQTQFTNAQVAYQTSSTAAIQAAQSQIQNLRLQLAKTVIASPVDGTLASRSANVGEVVGPGQPVMSLVDNGPLKLVATLSATQTDLVKVGQPVNLRTDALPGESFVGKVSSVGPASIATGQFFPLEVRVFDPSNRLRVGMIATGNLRAQYVPTVPVIPTSAVVQIGNQNYVYRMVEGKAVRAPVQLGLSGKDKSGTPYQVVAGGLGMGDQIIVSPVDALWDGATVNMGG